MRLLTKSEIVLRFDTSSSGSLAKASVRTLVVRAMTKAITPNVDQLATQDVHPTMEKRSELKTK